MPAAPPLPIDDALPALRDALRAHARVVLVAPPGAGKTTLVPLVLRAETWAAAGRILVLEPRRVAARAAARRMAELVGEDAPGGTIGLATRLDRAHAIVATLDGLLLIRAIAGPRAVDAAARGLGLDTASD